MNTVIITWLLLVPTYFFVLKYEPALLRQQYEQATKSEDAGKEFHEKMQKYDDQKPIVLAYKAASEAIMAKYSWSPYSKLKHLSRSGDIFKQAVKLEPANPEIRFLRYTVEYYVPRYLNMSAHVAEDKKIVVESLLNYPKSGLDREAATLMRGFLVSDKENHCSKEEKARLLKVKI